MADVLDRIVHRLVGKQAKRAASYTETVAAIADGSEPNDVERVLSDAGKTPGDLEADVIRLRRRRDLAAALKEAENLDAELVEIQTAKRTIEAERVAAEERAKIAMTPLVEREKKIQKLKSAASTAADELRRTAPKDLLDQIQELSQRQRDLQEAIATARASRPESLPTLQMESAALLAKSDALQRRLLEA